MTGAVNGHVQPVVQHYPALVEFEPLPSGEQDVFVQALERSWTAASRRSTSRSGNWRTRLAAPCGGRAGFTPPRSLAPRSAGRPPAWSSASTRA